MIRIESMQHTADIISFNLRNSINSTKSPFDVNEKKEKP